MSKFLGVLLTVAAAFAAGLTAEAQTEKWDKDIGKPAPRLFPAGWIGTPVSLDALVKSRANSTESLDSGSTVARKAEVGGGNTVVLAFWNADIPC
jgi:hypothetical protein